VGCCDSKGSWDSKDIAACGSRDLGTCPHMNCICKLQPRKQARGAERMHNKGWIENQPFCTGCGLDFICFCLLFLGSVCVFCKYVLCRLSAFAAEVIEFL